MQAVVLADSFANNFRPVTFQQPKVLMPLVNVPMLEYTCEFLAAGGMHEIFIFCCSHKEEVKRYIHESGLERRLGTVRLQVLIANGPCFSAGDALREIEAMDVITSDFVLVPGDVVANVQLAPLIAEHKRRREIDSNAVLTTLMKRVPLSHHSRRAGENMMVAMAGETGRLLLYEDAAKSLSSKKLRLPLSLLQESDRLQVPLHPSTPSTAEPLHTLTPCTVTSPRSGRRSATTYRTLTPTPTPTPTPTLTPKP